MVSGKYLELKRLINFCYYCNRVLADFLSPVRALERSQKLLECLKIHLATVCVFSVIIDGNSIYINYVSFFAVQLLLFTFLKVPVAYFCWSFRVCIIYFLEFNLERCVLYSRQFVQACF